MHESNIRDICSSFVKMSVFSLLLIEVRRYMHISLNPGYIPTILETIVVVIKRGLTYIIEKGDVIQRRDWQDLH